ncbi:MAG: S41 family peptidase [bacterium]|nr:S41 family peptidase [bacterium]
MSYELTPFSSRMSWYRKLSIGVAVVFVLGATFYGGVYAGSVWDNTSTPGSLQGIFGNTSTANDGYGNVKNADKIPDYLSKDVNFQLFWDVWRLVKKESVTKDTPDIKLFYGALSGVVSALDDPYSVYFDPDMHKKFNEDLSGSFEGIGAEIGIKDDQLIIVTPLAGNPAEKAGILAGDKIIEVDGKSTVGMSVDEAVDLIRGVKGTTVTLTLFRDGDVDTQKIEITRDTITIDSVTWEMKDNNIAYIKVSHFNRDTEGNFAKAVDEALAKKPKGVILDLRNNPGGFLDTAIQMAGYWIDGKPVVTEKYSDEKQDVYKARSTAKFDGIKTMVLVNEGSASASEIVAGALQDYKVATLVGMKTFGKGSVQDIRELSDGSAVKLTIAKWLTPEGRSINKEGIAPDIEVKITQADRDAKNDPQLDRAIEEMNK